jgi:outer membrane receptor protein involved in Fe transport
VIDAELGSSLFRLVGMIVGPERGLGMRTRHLVIASISMGLVRWSEPACAQESEQQNVHVLPPTVITVTKPKPRRRPEQVSRVAEPETKLVVYPTSPLSSSDVAADKVPAATSVVSSQQIEQTHSPSITDSLLKYVPSVATNDVTGNAFQPDIQFRGFVASPIDGTPQGLAVYQNGVRINEAFGDTVNWGLIPTAAIKSVAMVTNNPSFGLNALGGAVDIEMKDGFNYHGAEIDTMGGSFGRVQSSAQWGQQFDNVAVYGALEGVHEDGFRNFSQSDIRRFYSDVGVRNGDAEIHLNMGVADAKFGASATVPAELLQQFWGATYTAPQTSANKVAYANLTGKFDISPSWTVEGIAHVRLFNQGTVDGNPTGTQLCDADPTLLCFGNGSTPANGLNGVQLSTPPSFANAILGEIDRTTTRSTTTGVSLQATNTDELFGHGNHFVVGSSLDTSVTHFGASAEIGTFDPSGNFVINGSGIFLGTSGSPVSDGPVALRATNAYTGFYALDTFDVTKAFSITAGGRYNIAQINLQDELNNPALNGSDIYTRFNPIIGGTYKITPGLTAYAGYSEANRAPTPLELECADPTRPCILATFLVADPPLKQVVSRTVEAGFRGTQDLAIGALSWKVGVYRADNSDDILQVPSTVQGFGSFQNVGGTRRQGIETEVTLKSKQVQLNASYALVDARFRDAILLPSPNSPFADANGNIQVLPGDVVPSIPRHRVKAGIDYAVTDAWKFGGDMLYVSSQYFAGDASNQFPQLPSYTVFNLHSSYQVDKNVQVYARLDNVFDNRYATFGTFFDINAIPNFANGGAPFTDPRSLSPARPRALYVGLRATF